MRRNKCDAERERRLLDGDALGKIPRLVDVAASADGYVVGEELEGDDFEDGQEQLVGLRDVDDVLDQTMISRSLHI